MKMNERNAVTMRAARPRCVVIQMDCFVGPQAGLLAMTCFAEGSAVQTRRGRETPPYINHNPGWQAAGSAVLQKGGC
jgi:hypothetical protein